MEVHLMNVTVNGEPLKTNDGITVATLLCHLRIERERVAFELNADIIPKSMYESQLLSEGDRIEIVHFVGGGQPV
jgi:thiamine biosynthesis protein ThiS